MGLFAGIKGVFAAREYAKHVESHLSRRGCNVDTKKTPYITKLIMAAIDSKIPPETVVEGIFQDFTLLIKVYPGQPFIAIHEKLNTNLQYLARRYANSL
jgi:hypothetical protein